MSTVRMSVFFNYTLSTLFTGQQLACPAKTPQQPLLIGHGKFECGVSIASADGRGGLDQRAFIAMVWLLVVVLMAVLNGTRVSLLYSTCTPMPLAVPGPLFTVRC